MNVHGHTDRRRGCGRHARPRFAAATGDERARSRAGEGAADALAEETRVAGFGRRPRPSFKYSRLYAAVSRGRRLPRDLWRRSPRNLLAETIVRVRVVTVKRDATGALKAESLWYSKIDKVVSIVAGTPPAFREVKS